MSRRSAGALAIAALALTAGGCGGDDPNDTDQITAVIERVATSGDPSVCAEAQTLRFTERAVGEGLSGAQAVAQCRKNADRGVADEVDVSDLEVQGSTATANAAITGSTFDGQTLQLALVKDGDAWKLDEFTGFETFDRSKIAASFSAELASSGAPKAGVDCVRKGFASLTDAQVKGYLLSQDEEAMALLFGPCERFLGAG